MGNGIWEDTVDVDNEVERRVWPEDLFRFGVTLSRYSGGGMHKYDITAV